MWLCDDTQLMARFRRRGRRPIRFLGLLIAAGFLALACAGSSSASPLWPASGHARVVGVVLRSGPRVALTFDDCENATAWRSILSTLHRANVRATFFCLGTSVEGHGKLAKRVGAYGSMLCNHTWSHRDLTTLGDEAIKQQLLSTRRAIRHITGSTCRYMRPPYGSYDRRVLEIAGGLGYQRAALWTVDPRDWQQPGASVITARVLSQTRRGSIVLMHVLPETAAALPAILKGLHRHSLQPVTLATLVRIGAPTNGGWPSYRQLPR
jgi:peptidoglycan/xylan/chitin deacetylase (PgdA/CDA1 family)